MLSIELIAVACDDDVTGSIVGNAFGEESGIQF